MSSNLSVHAACCGAMTQCVTLHGASLPARPSVALSVEELGSGESLRFIELPRIRRHYSESSINSIQSIGFRPSLAAVSFAVNAMEKGPLLFSSTPVSPTSLKTTDPSQHDLQPELERQAVRKLDYNILPIISLFYLVSFLVCFVL